MNFTSFLFVIWKLCSFPNEFILKIMVILNKGSIHSATRAESDLNQNLDANLRENFAKICFETLLQYSLLDQVRISERQKVGKCGNV